MPTPPSRRDDLLADLADALIDVARSLQDHGYRDPELVPLTRQEITVISHIHRHPGTIPKELAADLGLKSSNASTALRGLEAKGMVVRTPDPADGRRTHLDLTDLAEDSIRRVRDGMSRLLHPLDLDDRDLARTVEALRGLTVAAPSDAEA
ncbi:hypothetical protein GCM10022377_19420 [Zhihengliuella alba]|uniref:HTH marR-type domain-containing protein n=1 Tax=Zhihengliuella alba TaxID=547018 RepID=A0ABP7DK07_9MICC